MARHNDIGTWGEELAASYLSEKGYCILQRDWMIGHRDLDIVAIDPETQEVVFVEVKTRSDDDLAEPEDAITRKKMQSLGYAADAYIKTFSIDNKCRFDVICIVGTPEKNYEIRHLKYAFNPLLL